MTKNIFLHVIFNIIWMWKNPNLLMYDCIATGVADPDPGVLVPEKLKSGSVFGFLGILG